MYELRRYLIIPGRLEEFVNNAARYGPLMEKHGFEIAGCWAVEDPPADATFNMVYLLRWESAADRAEPGRNLRPGPPK